MTTLFSSRDRATADLSRTLARLAPTDLSLVIEGETGTGKSFVATRLHRHGRRGRPLAVVDCGAIPATLFASELFGHRAGAFTDATRPREGWCAHAGAGTLVLDRVDLLPLEVQATLLRVVEERRFFPVGAATARAFRARVVALADQGLREKVGAGTFRADLYHRLAGFHAVLPPLRNRPQDILPFARAALRRLGRAAGRALALDPAAERLLLAYPWLGNFRELHAVLTRAALEATDCTVGVVTLALPGDSWPALAELAGTRHLPLAEVDRLYALFVLAAHKGNVTQAARVLGVSRRTLIRWRRQP
ncbi:MAG: sigma-54-dependent transcriptional regulator [Thermoanaerobaculales bacterium]